MPFAGMGNRSLQSVSIDCLLHTRSWARQALYVKRDQKNISKSWWLCSHPRAGDLAGHLECELQSLAWRAGCSCSQRLWLHWKGPFLQVGCLGELHAAICLHLRVWWAGLCCGVYFLWPLSLCLSLFLCLHVSLSIPVSVSISVSLCPSKCLPVSEWCSVSLSVSLCFSVSISLSVFLFLSL